MKRILKMILTGILLFCTAFSIVGCGEESGITEEERIAYENIEKYHAEMIISPDSQFNLEYQIANRTRGNQYNFETKEFSYDCPDAKDETLPESRLNVITTQEELEEAFSVFPEIDFEKEMVLICFYTSDNHTWERKLEGILIDGNDNLQIEFSETEAYSYKDPNKVTGLPPVPDNRTFSFIVKMDKVRTSSVKFIKILDYYVYNVHIRTKHEIKQ